jgi:hypothetical protein
MNIPLHGKKYVNCQYTHELIEVTDDNYQYVYRIPMHPKKDGFRTWKHTYSSPGAALAGLREHGNKSGHSDAIMKELATEFTDSLVPRDEHTEIPADFCIIVAPPHTLLEKHFDELGAEGKLSLAEYHKKYDHDRQVLFYRQEIAGRVKVNKARDKTMHEGEIEDRAANAPKDWFYGLVRQGAVQDVRSMKTPRGLSGCIEFFKGLCAPGESAITLYFNPESETIVGAGSPACWLGEGNKAASDYLGHTTVFGSSVHLIHKFPLKSRKRLADVTAPLPLKKRAKKAARTAEEIEAERVKDHAIDFMARCMAMTDPIPIPPAAPTDDAPLL